MPYLAPPPDPAPVVVVRDIGGSFAAYKRQTDLYRAQNREVRLRECRSACTLALSLPRVCVYTTSILRFNKAYDPATRRVDFAATEALFRAYPASVRARLGYLTRKFKTLSGEELIALGVRDCDAQVTTHVTTQVTTQVNAHVGPQAEAREAKASGMSQMLEARSDAAYVPPGQGPVARFLSRVGARVSATVTSGAPARFVTKWSGKVIGILPDRKTLTALLPGGSGAEKPSQPGLDPNTGPAFASASTIGSAPLPPPRPGRADAAGDDRPDGAAGHIAKLPRIISGGYATLPAQFSAYAPLR